MFAASVVVENQAGEILLVKEGAPEVQGKYNLPGGRAQDGESPLECASRELFEETGLRLTPTDLLGIYRHTGGMKMNFVFYAAADGHQQAKPNTDEILACEWLSQDAVRQLPDEQVFRHQKLLMIMEDLEAGHVGPVDLIRNVPAESWERLGKWGTCPSR